MSDDAHDIGAEQSLLGAVLVAPDVAAPALLSVPEDAWWKPRHRDLAIVMAGRIRKGQPIDPQLVLTELIGRIGHSDAGPYLHTLMSRAWSAPHASDYAARVLHCAARRNLSASATLLRQRLEQSWVNGWDEPVADFTKDMRAACDAAERFDGGADVAVESETVAELLDGSDAHDWLVPGLLERGDRMILTGMEGLGKSVLVTQIAVCMAAGLHPFTALPLGRGNRGLRVLVVDCENSRLQSRRRFRSMVRRANGPAGWQSNLRIELRPQGINLLGRDAAWLEQRVAVNAPDILAIGPLYRLHFSNMNDELAARELVAVLDGIRTRHGVALISEAHAGHERDSSGERRLRPTGSSLFLRWPEFGFGLSKAKGAEGEHPKLVDVIAWRGSREERQWPKQLTHSDGPVPWAPPDMQAYMEEAA